MFRFLLSLLVFFIYPCLAAGNDTLSIDRSVATDMQTFFPNDKNIQPKRSDFKVLNYILMSSESGERWVWLL